MAGLTQKQREIIFTQAEFIAAQAWMEFVKTSSEAETNQDADDSLELSQIAANAATVMHAFRQISG